MTDLLGLPVHHIGVALEINDFKNLTYNLDINDDKTQGVQTYFDFNQTLQCYIEYFTISGRARNYRSGFNHVCYNIKNLAEFTHLHNYIKQNAWGIQITKIEKSGSKECNNVVFFYFEKFGIVEFNICD